MIKVKVAFLKVRLFPVNQGFLKTFQIALIGWIKAGPPKNVNSTEKEKLNPSPLVTRLKLTGLLNGSLAEKRIWPFSQDAVNPERATDWLAHDNDEKFKEIEPELASAIVHSYSSSTSCGVYVTLYIGPS